ncbi:MAG: dipeptidase [Steroidobacteraceae bacterium]
MNRRDCLITGLSAAAMVPAMRASAAQGVCASAVKAVWTSPSCTSVDKSKDREALKIERSTLVVDGLDPSALTEKYLPMLKSGGVDCWHESVGGLASFARVLSFLDKNSETIVGAGTVREIRQIHEQGKIAHICGWQSAGPLLSDANGRVELGNLRAYHRLGLRIAGIAYNNSNIFGGGCIDPDVPLTVMGRRYVEEVHKQRLLLDCCGHTNDRTGIDAIRISPGVPVICSHTNVKALNNNPRNISDKAIEAIAKTGGVVGLTSDSDLIDRSIYDANVPHSPQVGLGKLLDQFDYVKKLVGADYVGIGPDFMTGRTDLNKLGMQRQLWPADIYSAWPWKMVKGFETIVQLPNLVQGLLNRGWSVPDVRKVLGENWLRVYEKAWGA